MMIRRHPPRGVRVLPGFVEESGAAPFVFFVCWLASGDGGSDNQTRRCSFWFARLVGSAVKRARSANVVDATSCCAWSYRCVFVNQGPQPHKWDDRQTQSMMVLPGYLGGLVCFEIGEGPFLTAGMCTRKLLMRQKSLAEHRPSVQCMCARSNGQTSCRKTYWAKTSDASDSWAELLS